MMNGGERWSGKAKSAPPAREGRGVSERAAKWVGGLAEWTDEDTRTVYLSVAFTWRLPEARARALWYRALGYHVRAGGPGTFRPAGWLAGVAELGGAVPDAVVRHNPMATFASRGCPVNCSFCIVPKMEGLNFTLVPEFTPRPILCDNNLSGLPVDYQRHIIERYQAAGVPLLDAQSGFEPRTFDAGTYERWAPINRGPWRFAYDEMDEREEVRQTMATLRERGVHGPRMRVYVLIGNEPFAECMQRIREVIEWGGEPHTQPYIKLNALTKDPWVRHDWSLPLLRQVSRWTNRHLWRNVPFEEYRAGTKVRDESQLDLFAPKPDPSREEREKEVEA
jgi:hypothetical protein